MRAGVRAFFPAVIFLPVLWLAAGLAVSRGHTWVELTDTETGRRIISQPLRDGEPVVLTWRNSLFDLLVTEVFVAKAGILELTEVTFADPRGGEPPPVRPVDLDDLYQTGGAFRVKGPSKTFSRVIFRVGEIGDPTVRIGRQQVRMRQQVGFGGAVLLVARRPRLYESAVGRLLR